MEYLVESALLTHGLKSVSNETIKLVEKQSGALTASGTMAVCVKMGIPVAITCGMGGIGDIKGEELCPDLPALQQIPVVLISAGPKDMLDRKATIGRKDAISILRQTERLMTVPMDILH